VRDLLERLTNALADRYAVERELGRGGMATVFLAEDLKHHRKVAIKVLHPELASVIGPDRFLREIEAVAGLTHPHVLPLHDSGEVDGLLFYVMPYVEGESLRQRLDRERQLPVEEAVRITQDVAEALDHAHRNGLVHRDIKPGNILLEEGHAVVTDFGVARALSEAGTAKVTATGMSVGTSAYMSPEQASGGEIDARSDLYALGCVLYEMLAGEPPLVGSTPQATAAKRLTDRPTPLSVLRSTVPSGLDEAVQKALETSPADRYATAPELATALESGMSGRVGVVSTRRRFQTRLIAAIAICAVALASWLTTRSHNARTTVAHESIAVLPFVNMSDDPGNEYFSDGISEELLNLLAKIPELRVTSRSSAFSFKGQNLTIVEIAARLNVANILEGSVRKAGNEVRITAQLIDARSDTHLWSYTWDRTLEDVFKIQDEIASEVVAQLRIKLLGDAPKARTTDPRAYALFLQARQLYHQGSAQSLERSTELLQEALAIDPGYPPAWAQLATVYRVMAGAALLPFEEGIHLAREAGERALAIDPDYAPAHAALGRSAMRIPGDLGEAAAHMKRALDLAPTDTDILNAAGILANFLGRLNDGITILEDAVASDPANANLHHSLATSYRWAGRWDEALSQYGAALDLSPGHIASHFGIGLALLGKGEPEAALEAMRQEPDEEWRVIGLALIYHALGRNAESDSTLAESIEKNEAAAAYNIAYIYAYRGEADSAFQWLRKAADYRDTGLSEIAVAPWFANIESDPRWLPFLESIGRSPDQLATIDFEVKLPK
jgi:serine/threonine-protein kinase